jgi:DNA-binding transcriptional LysR family regulator
MNTPAGNRKFTVNPIMSLSSLVMVRDAVRAGAGAALLPVSLVSRELATGTMVQWGDVEGPDIALWALYPTRRLLSARVSAFLNFLKDAFPQGSPDELAAYIA